ncbi:MAG: DUF2007 domain-containing protein [Archangium sp.]|nr:DUF2007 domain-containing protein [Archangium sp.]
MTDEDELAQVVLIETTNAMELSMVKSLLDGEGVLYVVRAEHHHTMDHGLFGNPAYAPQVLVNRKDLERAKALLAAKPVTTVEGICTVHEKSSIAVCGQCEAHLCGECTFTRGPPVLCEDCGNGVPQHRTPGLLGTDTAKKTVASVMLLPVLLFVAAALIAIVMRLFGVR